MDYSKNVQLESIVKSDPIYQDTLKSCLSLEQDYLRIRDMLSESDRELLDHYICLCEELDHRKPTIALTL